MFQKQRELIFPGTRVNVLVGNHMATFIKFLMQLHCVPERSIHGHVVAVTAYKHQTWDWCIVLLAKTSSRGGL
jgi:hypothetical protein